jgi:hypothetical protein
VDRVHGAVGHGHQTEGAVAPHRRAAHGRGSSPVLTGDGGGGRAGRGGAREVLTGDGGVAERRRTRGNERQRLELIARAKEGAKELGREGMRCGESRGSHRPFIGVGERRRGVAGGSNSGVNGINAIEGRGEVKRGIKEGERPVGKKKKNGPRLG